MPLLLLSRRSRHLHQAELLGTRLPRSTLSSAPRDARPANESRGLKVSNRPRFQALPKAFEDSRMPSGPPVRPSRTLALVTRSAKAWRGFLDGFRVRRKPAAQSSEDCCPDESVPRNPRTRSLATGAHPVVLGHQPRFSGRLHQSSRRLCPVSRQRLCAPPSLDELLYPQVSGLAGQTPMATSTGSWPSPRTRSRTLPPARMTSSSSSFTLTRAFVLPFGA